jgi:hypothetical protein
VAWLDDPLHSARQTLLATRGAADPEAVDLLPENRTIGEIYMLTRNQVVTVGPGRPIAVSIPAVKIAMDALGVTEQSACLKRVVRLWHDVQDAGDEGD